MPISRPVMWSAALMLGTAAMPGAGDATTLCSVSASPLVFGSYAIITGLDPAGDLPRDTSADVVVSCSGDAGTSVGVEIQLDGGATGNPLARAMNGAGALPYNIYADAARISVWGDGTNGSARTTTIVLPAGSATASATLTAYGRIPPLRTAPVGTYTDTVLVTVLY